MPSNLYIEHNSKQYISFKFQIKINSEQTMHIVLNHAINYVFLRWIELVEKPKKIIKEPVHYWKIKLFNFQDQYKGISQSRVLFLQL